MSIINYVILFTCGIIKVGGMKMITVGDKIREYRKMRNMTQAELAERVHVMQNTISSWESGRTEPRMGMIEVLAEVLNCRKSDLIGEVSVHE